LRGKAVFGIYPLLPDETCCFLAMDFDDEGWQKDVRVLRDICTEKDIPFAVERSQSGNGGHVWFFFKDQISAATARKFGTLLLTHAMSKRHEIKFSSYDRLFPNQDTLPKGGFGNLIALPFRDEQVEAVSQMLPHDNGVLAATTAFGKTVIGAKLIAERKVNTLVLVHTQQLLEQWKQRLTQFLTIYEELPADPVKRRGRKKVRSIIGQLGGGKKILSGIIDIALMQSLVKGDEVKDAVRDYGMVIVDECHHVPAFSFEQILKNVSAKYVYGLTATPVRQDGHHPIIFMHCGPVRYKVDARVDALCSDCTIEKLKFQ